MMLVMAYHISNEKMVVIGDSAHPINIGIDTRNKTYNVKQKLMCAQLCGEGMVCKYNKAILS